MARFKTLLLLGAIAVATGSLLSTAHAAQSKITKPPTGSLPLTNEDLYKLYGNRSWIWKDGAGYFAVKQRQFSAWSGEGKGSYGLGRWFLTEPGKLCFRAVWYAETGNALALTCFSHRKKGNVIFQKREPDGEWYPFKTMPAKQSDEYRKFEPLDYVTQRFNRMRTQLSQNE
jgi:hypothetical protein